MSEENLESVEDQDLEATEQEFEENVENEGEDLTEFKASFGDPSTVPEPVAKKAAKRRGDKDGKEAAMTGPTSVKPQKVSAEDIDIDDDVLAIFEGVDLSEETRDKAKTIFEAMIVTKINEQVEAVAADLEEQYASIVENIANDLTSKLDDYLNYAVSEWMEENKLAVESGIRTEMTEDFLTGLKKLFDENYVNIPEEKVEVVEELVAKVEELEEKLNEETNRSIELAKEVRSFQFAEVFAEATNDLSDVQAEKLRTLSEGVSAETAEEFAKKVAILKEQYFTDESDDAEIAIVDDEKDPISIEEETQGPTGVMAQYMSAISKTIRK